MAVGLTQAICDFHGAGRACGILAERIGQGERGAVEELRGQVAEHRRALGATAKLPLSALLAELTRFTGDGSCRRAN